MAQMNHLEYIEYLFHEREKNGLEDLKKARKHLDWLIEFEEE